MPYPLSQLADLIVNIPWENINIGMPRKAVHAGDDLGRTLAEHVRFSSFVFPIFSSQSSQFLVSQYSDS